MADKHIIISPLNIDLVLQFVKMTSSLQDVIKNTFWNDVLS